MKCFSAALEDHADAEWFRVTANNCSPPEFLRKCFGNNLQRKTWCTPNACGVHALSNIGAICPALLCARQGGEQESSKLGEMLLMTALRKVKTQPERLHAS